MRVVIFGATGGTGTHLVRFAQEAGHELTVLVRTPGKCSDCMGARIIQGDARNPEDVSKAVEGQDAVLVALGGDSLKQDDLLEQTSSNIIAAMKSHGVKRIVILGAAGALHDAQKYQTWRRKLFFSAFAKTMLKYPMMDSAAQERQIEASDLDYTVVHPPRLLNIPATGKLREMSDGLPSRGYSISREEVASFMVRILADPKYFRTGPYIAY